ncbi:MAG: DNA-3-methyladenine glycosylase [Hadesarchaea archaeon]|nr:DNA-3-methyladenine glycosylase [Hadesarchaea archaeon]
MLNQEFYDRDTARVACELLGKILFHDSSEGFGSGVIVETEAYYGEDDPASRAAGGKKTKISENMWKRGGLSLIYMVHSNWLFNVTTETKNTPGAVLIRALEPLEGLDLMRDRRGFDDVQALASGPGKLTQALGITKNQHGVDLTQSKKLGIKKSDFRDFEVERSHRIGVSRDLDEELRFYVSGSDFVSK